MEKKLKKAADTIKMPEDMKQRIIKAAELAEKNRSNTDNNDGYIDVVSSAERVNPRNHIIRTICSFAACAVLVSGIGAAGMFLHVKHKEPMTTGDSTECISCPFGDFSEFEYRFDAGDGKFGKYSAETYAKLSDFLNKFNWGAELTEYETRTADQDVKGQIYDIKWTMGDTPPIECNIHIANDGFVTYSESMMDFETGTKKIITENSRCYKIDFNAFDSGIQAILADEPGSVSPFGDLSEVDIDLEVVDSKIIGYSDETRKKIADFLNGFNWSKELDLDSLADNDDIEFNKKYIFSWEKDKISHTLAVGDEGLALYLEMEASHENSVHRTTGGKAFWIDFEAFDRGITDILTGKNVAVDSDKLTGEVDRITTELGEKCETEGWEYLIKTVDVTKSGEGMSTFKEGHYSSNSSGDLTCDSSYIIADMELTNKSSEDRSIYMDSTRIDLYNYNADELDFKTSVEATVYTFNGERSRYSGDFFKTDFKAGETKTFRVGYVIDDEYLDKNFDIIRIEINHSGMADNNDNIRYYKLGENTNLSAIAKYKAEAPTEVFEYAELIFNQHEKLTPTDEEGIAKFEDFVRNDFVTMLEPTSSDDIVGGIKYTFDLLFKLDNNKKRNEQYFIYMDGFVIHNEYESDEKGEMQLTNTENYQIDMARLESVLKDEIGVELPEYREININKVD